MAGLLADGARDRIEILVVEAARVDEREPATVPLARDLLAVARDAGVSWTTASRVSLKRFTSELFPTFGYPTIATLCTGPAYGSDARPRPTVSAGRGPVRGSGAGVRYLRRVTFWVRPAARSVIWAVFLPARRRRPVLVRRTVTVAAPAREALAAPAPIALPAAVAETVIRRPASGGEAHLDALPERGGELGRPHLERRGTADRSPSGRVALATVA